MRPLLKSSSLTTNARISVAATRLIGHRRRMALAGVFGTLLIVGCSGGSATTSDDVDSELQERFRGALIECVRDAGFDDYTGDYSETELAQGAPIVDAVATCERETAARPEFSEFQDRAGDDREIYAKRVADAWSVWKCVEEAGYTRVTPIPLTAPDGRPLLPTIRNFQVDEGESAVETFYSTAASCGDGDIDRYKFDGRFLGMDDITACNEENIGVRGYDDVTGCYNVDEYPTGT